MYASPMESKLFGYESLQNDFKRLIENNGLNHAYLFYGEPEIGKFLFAQQLAEKIAHRDDIYTIDSHTIQKTKEDAEIGSIGIEAVRELENFLYRTPLGKYRVVLIRDAQHLTDQAQSALLKTLEEPPRSGIILATITDPTALLLAIQSRFQSIFMPILHDTQILDFINKSGIICNQKEDVVSRARGRIGRALTILNKEDGVLHTAIQLAQSAVVSTSETQKKNITDEILDFFDAGSENLNCFIEALEYELNTRKNTKAMRALHEFAYNTHTSNIQKRIHLKKVLWMI